jgi:hypothetical protein
MSVTRVQLVGNVSTGASFAGIITSTSIVVSAGTTSAPSISPSGDSNTGIFFPSADTIAASTGGTSRITIDSSGNITVTNNLIIPLGTSLLPSLAFLSDPNTGIYSPGADQLAVATNGSGKLYIDSAGVITTDNGFASGRLNVVNSNTVTTFDRMLLLRSSNLSNAYLGLGSDSFYVASASNAPIVFCTNSDGGTSGSSVPTNERLRITSAGLMGLGTSSPTYFLQVKTNTAPNVNKKMLFLEENTPTSGWSFNIDDITTGSLFLNKVVTGTESTRITVTNSGAVGINTTSPQQLLHVNSSGSNGGQLQITNASTGAASTDGLLVGYNTSNDVIFNNQEATLTKFFTSGLERVAIDSSGRLLVGTSSALAAVTGVTPALQVQGTGENAYASIARWAANSANPGLIFNKSRGASVGTRGVVAADDRMGEVAFGGDDGTSFIIGASIVCDVDGTPGTNDMPGRIVLATTADGASTPTERMRIDSAGNIITTGTFVDPAITGTILEDVFTITDGAAFEIDPGNGSIQLITLGASRTPKATNMVAGESITLMVDDGSAYTLTWSDATFGGSGVVWKTNAGVAPTLNTTGYTVIVLWKVSTQVYGARVGDA